LTQHLIINRRQMRSMSIQTLKLYTRGFRRVIFLQMTGLRSIPIASYLSFRQTTQKIIKYDNSAVSQP
jgi:hypothetical protein